MEIRTVNELFSYNDASDPRFWRSSFSVHPGPGGLISKEEVSDFRAGVALWRPNYPEDSHPGRLERIKAALRAAAADLMANAMDAETAWHEGDVEVSDLARGLARERDMDLPAKVIGFGVLRHEGLIPIVQLRTEGGWTIVLRYTGQFGLFFMVAAGLEAPPKPAWTMVAAYRTADDRPEDMTT